MKEKTPFNQLLRAVKDHVYPHRLAPKLRNAQIARQEGRYFKSVKGVIHVGASIDQSRDFYAKYDLDVLWIEPIPEVYANLVKNISGYPKQIAVNALITDRDGADYKFHVA